MLVRLNILPLASLALAAAAYAHDGVIDPGFGTYTGITLPYFDQGGAQFYNQDVAHALMREAGGKYLLVGNVRVADQGTGHWGGGAVRLNDDGTPDSSFGNGLGQSLSGDRQLLDSGFQGVDNLLIYSVQPEPSGYALLAGETIDTNGVHRGWYREVANVQFGTGTSALGPDYSFYAQGFFLPGDNTTMILIGGKRLNQNADLDLYLRIETRNGFSYTKSYEATTSSVGNGYGQQGTYRFVPSDCSGEFCTQPRERIFVVGYFDDPNGYGDCYITGTSRALPNGNWVSDQGFARSINFDNAVIPNQSTHTRCHAIALQRDGKILIGGEAYVRVQGSQTDNASYWVVARLNPDGSLDTSFNPNGPMPGARAYFFQALPVSDGAYNGIYSLAVQQDGRIVFAGYAGSIVQAYGAADMGFGRLRNDGSLDDTFGNGGISIVTLDSGTGTGQREFALGAILEPGRISAAGTREYSGDDYDFMATRLIDDDLIFADDLE